MKTRTLAYYSIRVEIALLILVLLSLWGVGGTQSAWADAPRNLDWRFHGNDLHNTRFQDVDKINPSNVKDLKVAWVFHTGVFNEGASLQVTPIVVNGVMYVTDGHSDVFALNAATGNQLWAYKPANELPPLTPEGLGPRGPTSFSGISTCCGLNNQGVAFGNKKVFLGRIDGVLVALDAKKGNVVWKTKVVDFHKRFSIMAAPQFVDVKNGLVIVGAAGGEYEVRGQLAAFEADTGKEVWRFRTTDPDSYDGKSWRTGGATVWNTPAIDRDLGLLYVTTGNAAPDILGENRAGDNLFAASIVALDLETGKPRWHFQEVHHDIWDYDSAAPPHLFPLKKDGKEYEALGHCSKNGQYYILNRRTGEHIFPVTEERVPTPLESAFQNPAPTQPFSAVEPLTPLRFDQLSPAEMPDIALINNNPNFSKLFAPGQTGVELSPQYTPPDEKLRLIMPGDDGGCEWNPAAFSPRTKYAYYGTRHEPHLFQTHPGNKSRKDGLHLGSNFINRVPGTKPFGVYGATDTQTGKVVWKIRLPQPAKSGVLVAGDVMFFGEGNGTFHGVNARTGEKLFKFDAPAEVDDAGGAAASPIAYVARGREFIVNAFGGNVPDRNNFGADATTGMVNCSSVVKRECENPVGDAIIAFALPRHPDK